MKHDFFTIKGFNQSAYAELTNPDGRLKVELPTGGSSLTDTELRAAHLDVQQVSGATDSVYVIGAFGSTAVTGIINADNRLRVSLETGGSGLTDSELRASSVPVEQVSGSTWSTYVTGSTGTIATYSVNTDGTYRDTTPISGSVSVTGSITSTVVTGVTVADAADDGSAPIKRGGIARITNPAAVADGDIVSASCDDIGRTLIRPVQVRDLLTTATATLTTGTETTLLVSAASTFNDLIYVMGANSSDAAATVDIRSGTANSVLMTLQIPANGTAGVALPVPFPQETAAATWTADMNDITGTTVYVSALFSKEV